MRRGLWFAAGAGAGIYAMTRARRLAEAFTVDGLRDRWEAVGLGARMLRDDVAQAQAEKETELRERYGLAPHGLPSWPQPADRPRPAATENWKAPTDGHLGDSAEVRGSLRAGRARRRAVGVVDPRRPDAALRGRGDGAVQALLPRPGDGAVRPRGERAEVRPHARHRGRRQDHAARHVLRDVRQLLVRRLLQGRRDRARLGPGDRVPGRRRLRPRGEPDLPEHLRGRPRGGVPLEQGDGRARRPDHPARQEGELLVHGRARAGWSVLGDPLRPRGGVRAGPRLRPQGRGPLPRDLEPRLHAGRAQRGAVEGGLRHRGLAAEEEHRHGHGPGAGRLPAAGRRQHVRDRRDVPGDREGRGADRPEVRRVARERRPVPGRGRPHPQHDDADQRRRHAGQRGPRLRPAPAAAPRGALDAAARHRGPRAAGAAARQPRQDGRDLHRAEP